jgi:hypothetical protein
VSYSIDPGASSGGATAHAVQTGCIAASLGADHAYGTAGTTPPKFIGSDDVLSWQ